MKHTYLFSAFLVCLFLNKTIAQNSSQCIHCNMTIQDKFHKASAKLNNKTIDFDAIECLINYLKTNNKLSSLQVSDYKTGKLTDAKTATYLKSKAIASPMGANLSAFKNKETAEKIKQEKGGELYSWESIKLKFKGSKFGSIDHNHGHIHIAEREHKTSFFV